VFPRVGDDEEEEEDEEDRGLLSSSSVSENITRISCPFVAKEPWERLQKIKKETSVRGRKNRDGKEERNLELKLVNGSQITSLEQHLPTALPNPLTKRILWPPSIMGYMKRTLKLSFFSIWLLLLRITATFPISLSEPWKTCNNLTLEETVVGK